MINHLIAQAATMKEIIAAANGLANAQFEFNSADLFQKKVGIEKIEAEIKNFRKTINSSSLEQAQKNELAGLSNIDLCSFASVLTIRFINQEIKILE